MAGEEEVLEVASNVPELSPEELIAKGRAPVKKEFLLKPTKRKLQVPEESNRGGLHGGKGELKGVSTESRVPKMESKSKRQQKRDRQEAKKTNICQVVAKTGNLSACQYGNNCRLSHDLDAFLASKPSDLPGICPFLDRSYPCPYGLACRFLGSHKTKRTTTGEGEEGEKVSIKVSDGDNNEGESMILPSSSAEVATVNIVENGHLGSTENGKIGIIEDEKTRKFDDERNVLSKELQRQLWKHTVETPRADLTLQSMGLLRGGKSQRSKQLPEQSKAKLKDDMVGPLIWKEDVHEVSNGMEMAVEGDEVNLGSEGKKDQILKNDAQMTENVNLVMENRAGDPGNEGQICAEGSDETTASDGVLDSGKRKFSGEIYTGGDKSGLEVVAENFDGKNAKKAKVTAIEISKISKEEMMEKGESDKVLESNGRYGDSGVVGDGEELKLLPKEKKLVDFRRKIYLAPLTTVGNLPFRRICKDLGADITCGEMAMCTNLLQGQASEWALLRRHSSEDVFGVQICGAHPDILSRAAEIIEKECDVDFIDINMGCPIDIVVNKFAGSYLLTKPMKMEQCIRATSASIESALTVKVRMAYQEGKTCVHPLMPRFSEWGVTAVTIHGRSRQQRYSRQADWNYVQMCAGEKPPLSPLQVIGNGDVFSYTEWNERLNGEGAHVDSAMVARGALIKPWLLTEIKEQRHWDISASERLEILQNFTRYGLMHWGSDSKGVETTRHFLLEWLSYLHRYIPVGVLEVVPQKLNWRPPLFCGRSDLETLLASDSAADWVRISEMLLGPPPSNFHFSPKHKSNAYDKAENG